MNLVYGFIVISVVDSVGGTIMMMLTVFVNYMALRDMWQDIKRQY